MKSGFNLSHIVILLLLLLPLTAAIGAADAQQFVHPGLLQSRADLDRMKSGVAAHQSPIYEGYTVFAASPQSQSSYVMRGPFEEIGRNPTAHFGEFDTDANAAYQCALMWTITGDKAYAEKSKQIVNGWSATLKTVSGADAVLMAGLGPFKLVNAAEILRYTDSGWSDADIAQCERMFKTAIYPTLKDFALFANGNWDTAAVKTVMAIGVFCNDRPMFERALQYYVHGAGDGRLTHYIYETGQCQESGRDQGHTQLGLAHLGDCCEIAWNQGLDLYAYNDNRLLTGFEYTAKYNLDGDAPFEPDLDQTGKYAHEAISAQGRGKLRPIYEQIYNHYVHRKGMAAPYTQQAAEKIRPEGAAQGADHPGFGTLLYTRTADAKQDKVLSPPATPAGLITYGYQHAINLSWVASVGAASYIVKRATRSEGPYVTLTQAIPFASYTDTAVKPGELYYYVAAAANTAGRSSDSLAECVSAGPPTSWSSQDIGISGVEGFTAYDGAKFTLEGAGAAIGGTGDHFRFAGVPLNGDGTITARFVPQVSSQFSSFGLMIRETLTPDSPHVSLLINPQKGESIEKPGWGARLITRSSAGAETAVATAGPQLQAPIVTYGRLMEPCWLKLERKDNVFTASTSPNGKTWTKVGVVTINLQRKVQMGLAACAGLPEARTTVVFDNVDVRGAK